MMLLTQICIFQYVLSQEHIILKNFIPNLLAEYSNKTNNYKDQMFNRIFISIIQNLEKKVRYINKYSNKFYRSKKLAYKFNDKETFDILKDDYLSYKIDESNASELENLLKIQCETLDTIHKELNEYYPLRKNFKFRLYKFITNTKKPKYTEGYMKNADNTNLRKTIIKKIPEIHDKLVYIKKYAEKFN